MRRPNRRQPRRGAVSFEAALTIPVFLTMVLGMIDLGLAVSRYHTVCLAARHGARQAAVHGDLAPAGWNGGPWGPAAVTQQANATAYPALAVAPMLANCTLADCQVVTQWPDNSNENGKRVRVTVSTTYTPMITYIFGGAAIDLTSSSTTIISH